MWHRMASRRPALAVAAVAVAAVLGGCANPFEAAFPDPTNQLSVRFLNAAPQSAFIQLNDGRRDRALAKGLNNALGGISLPSFDFTPSTNGLIFALAPQGDALLTLYVLKTTGTVDVFVKPNASEFSEALASFGGVKVVDGQTLALGKEGDKFTLK